MKFFNIFTIVIKLIIRYYTAMDMFVVSDISEGIERAKKFLYEKVDKRTVLFLSGGQSPKLLYQTLAKDTLIHPAAAAMIDERYGKIDHEKSNERMLRETGLLAYFQQMHIPFHPILKPGMNREATARDYDENIRNLFFHIPKSIALMGIGPDGHTAGIAPSRNDFPNPLFDGDRKSLLASEYDDVTGSFGERITLTFKALEMIDLFLVWVFGDEKKKALQQIFEKGSEEESPGRFFQRDEIAPKVTYITDQPL